jgi:hypothetical protein
MARKPKQQQPIVIDTADLTPQDLGSGYKLTFQRSTKDATQVRAVVKGPDGGIIVAGDVVPESNAFASRLAALHNMQHRNYNLSLGLRPDATKQDQLDALQAQIEKMYGGNTP